METTTERVSFVDIKKLRKWIAWHELRIFPFMPDVKIGIRVLTISELVSCKDIWRDKAKEALINPSQDDINDYIYAEVLYRAVLSYPVDWTTFFSSSEEALDLSIDESVLLKEYYEEVQEMYSPLEKVETEEQFNELISEIRKKSHLGMSLSSYTLRKLLLFMIENGKTLPSDNDSISSPSNKKEEILKTPTPKRKKNEIKLVTQK